MSNAVIKVDPFYNSIFLQQFYKNFIKVGNFYKIFIYFFFLNKLLKKKKLKIFSLISFIIINYYFSIETKSKILSKKKKTAKKFKRKRRLKRKGFFKKIFYLKLLNFPQIKLFKIIKKFYLNFIIKKNLFFLLNLYNSYISFFINNLNNNNLKKQYLREKYYAATNWSVKKLIHIKKKSLKNLKKKKKKVIKFKKISNF